MTTEIGLLGTIKGFFNTETREQNLQLILDEPNHVLLNIDHHDGYLTVHGEAGGYSCIAFLKLPVKKLSLSRQ